MHKGDQVVRNRSPNYKRSQNQKFWAYHPRDEGYGFDHQPEHRVGRKGQGRRKEARLLRAGEESCHGAMKKKVP